jgi:hypothetical protein
MNSGTPVGSDPTSIDTASWIRCAGREGRAIFGCRICGTAGS